MEDRVSLVLADCGRTLDHSRRVVWELATRLPRNRFHLRVWLSSAPEVDDLAHALEARAILVERIADPTPRWAWRSNLDARRRFFGARPALVHVFVLSDCGRRLATTLGEVSGASRVVVTHGGGGAMTEPPMCRLIERADAITAISANGAETLAARLGTRRAGVRVVPDGVDPPDEEAECREAPGWRERLGATPVRPLWVGFAREGSEGFETLLEALAELKRRMIPFAAGLVTAARDHERWRRRIEALDLDGSAMVVEGVENPGPLLAAADLAILPAPGEGERRWMMETLVRARPLIVGDTVVSSGLLVDGLDGRLVPCGDAAALADAIENAYRRPDAARRMAARGAGRMHDEYSWERVVESYEEIYDETLGLASFVPEYGRANRA